MSLEHKIWVQILEDYYKNTPKHVRAEVQKTLRASRATTMCYGSTNVNGAPMINGIVRLSCRMRVNTKTFFGTSIYTGYDTCIAQYYVAATEKVIEESNIGYRPALAVTKNTPCVRNAG